MGVPWQFSPVRVAGGPEIRIRRYAIANKDAQSSTAISVMALAYLCWRLRTGECESAMFRQSLLIRCDHQSIDQIPDGMRHFTLALAFPLPPLAPVLLFSRDFLLEAFTLIFEGSNARLPFPGHEILECIQGLIAGY